MNVNHKNTRLFQSTFQYCLQIYNLYAKLVIFAAEKKKTTSHSVTMAYNNKETYTTEQIEEIKAWYDAHQAELPKEIELCQGEVCKDLPKMVGAVLATAEEQFNNPTFKRLLQYLFDVRQKIEGQA